MANFAQRLTRAQANLPAVTEECIEHLTLGELKDTPMTFGKVHIGKPFEEVWINHPDWIRWFAAHYYNSSKLEHRKMIRYIHLKIEETETTEGPLQMPVAKAKSQPKSLAAKPKQRPAPFNPPTWVPESEVESFDMMSDAPWIGEVDAREEIQAIQSRMLNMENAIQRMMAMMTQGTMGASRPTPSEITETAVAEWEDPWNQ